MSDKPREFWLIETPLVGHRWIVNSTTHPGKYAHQHVHVIEYSHVQRLEARIEKIMKIFDSSVDELFTEIEHGDQPHRLWLSHKLLEWAGKTKMKLKADDEAAK